MILITKKLVDERQYLRAAYISVLNFDYAKAAECLKAIKLSERVLYSILKSLDTENMKNTINKFCFQLSFTASSIYVSAILAFFGGPTEILKLLDKIPFPDNLAYACIYLSDAQLKLYIKKLMEQYRINGDLNGIVLSGFNATGIEIMEAYLNKSSDIQTVGLLSVYARMVATNESSKLTEWINLYKTKLNNLELWIYRTRLEIEESRLFRSSKDNLRTSKCFYCSNLLTYQSENLDP